MRALLFFCLSWKSITRVILLDTVPYFVSKEEKKRQHYTTSEHSLAISTVLSLEQRRTVKMHILEMHNIEWMSTYNAGFGLMGEQGTDAIHAHFNKLYRIYGCMENKVQRLNCIMQEHHLT